MLDKPDQNRVHLYKAVVKKPPIRWMGHPYIVKTFNKKIYEYNSEVWGDGLLGYIKSTYLKNNRVFKKAVSVACGNGRKEIELVREGFVDHLTIYEISAKKIRSGQKTVSQLGLEKKVKFIHGSAFDLVKEKAQFDLVLWLNTLHLMEDTPKAIRWSHDVLLPGGFFVMDGYVGPNRFQWSRVVMEACNKSRERFSGDVYKRTDDQKKRPLKLHVIDPRLVEKENPNEAVDSARIMTTISDLFERRKEFIVSSGVSSLAMDDISSRILDKVHKKAIDYTIKKDLDLAKKGHLGFASVIGIKKRKSS